MNDIVIKGKWTAFAMIIHKEGLPWTSKNMKSLVKLINTEVSFDHRDEIFDKLIECLEHEKKVAEMCTTFKSKVKLCDRNIEIIKDERLKGDN